jgi:hypothetical protein
MLLLAKITVLFFSQILAKNRENKFYFLKNKL